MPHTEVRSPALCLDLVDAKLRDLIKQLGKMEIDSQAKPSYPG
jgi:hypothetical protein